MINHKILIILLQTVCFIVLPTVSVERPEIRAYNAPLVYCFLRSKMERDFVRALETPLKFHYRNYHNRDWNSRVHSTMTLYRTRVAHFYERIAAAALRGMWRLDEELRADAGDAPGTMKDRYLRTVNAAAAGAGSASDAGSAESSAAVTASESILTPGPITALYLARALIKGHIQSTDPWQCRFRLIVLAVDQPRARLLTRANFAAAPNQTDQIRPESSTGLLRFLTAAFGLIENRNVEFDVLEEPATVEEPLQRYCAPLDAEARQSEPLWLLKLLRTATAKAIDSIDRDSQQYFPLRPICDMLRLWARDEPRLRTARRLRIRGFLAHFGFERNGQTLQANGVCLEFVGF